MCDYGRNSNDVDFFRGLKARCDYNGCPTIMGGDFNTVIDNRGGDLSIDRLGEGACPNLQNSRFLNEWIEEGELVDPFRVLYPEKIEFSFTSFRRVDNIGKNRLDFFLISRELITLVKNVVYEDRLGRYFDHKEVTLSLGHRQKVRKEQIFKDTVNDERAKFSGIVAFYDTLNEHKRAPDEQLREKVGQTEQILKDIEKIKLAERWDELPGKTRELNEIMDTYPNTEELLEGEFSCNFRNLYEVVLMAIKNKLIGIQVNNKIKEGKIRKELNEQLKMYEMVGEKNSEGWKRVNEEILEMNDRDLKRRAGKFMEFLEQNNEKPTSIFYQLGKEKGGDDDTTQIRDNYGNQFKTTKKRDEHISKFYGELYKKKVRHTDKY